jgi:hypothetical protein
MVTGEIIPNKLQWKRQQELHLTSQRHAEWVAKQMLKRLRMLQEVFGWQEGTTSFEYLMPSFEKKYRIKGEHWAYARELVKQQIRGGKR